MFDPARPGRRGLGPLLTAALLALTEFAAHFVPAGTQVGVTILLLSLAAVAYAGLRAGFLNAFLCALMIAAYTFHYMAPHEQGVALDARGWSSALIMLILGTGMGWPMSRVRAREVRLRGALEARARELEARNRELTNANAALEAFGYVVSHDLKEPVRALENYLDAARQEWPGEESREYVDEAYAANQRLARLLQGLLSYSRTSSATPTLEPLDLATVLRSDACATQYAALQAERGAEVELAPDLPPVQGDPVILTQLFGNLVLNAIRHHPRPGGRVRIRRAEAPPGRAHIVVEDDGHGFPPDVLARFDRLQADRPATIKSGFGLAIAHRAAQRLGGRMWLENRANGGGAAAHVELAAVGDSPLSEVRNDRTSLEDRNAPTEGLLQKR